MNQNKGSAVLIGILSVVLVGVIAGTGYFVLKNYKAKSEGQPTTDLLGLQTPGNLPAVPDTSKQQSNQTPAPASGQNFFVVDASTGISITNPTFTINGQSFVGVSAFLSYIQTLSPGQTTFGVTASGYTNTSGVRINIPSTVDMTIHMDRLSPLSDGPTLAANKIRAYGYVTDEAHLPVSGVAVSLPGYNMNTTTGTNGFYSFDFIPTGTDACLGTTISFAKAGYKTYTITEFGSATIAAGMGGNKIGSLITLKQGSGTETKSEKHTLCQ